MDPRTHSDTTQPYATSRHRSWITHATAIALFVVTGAVGANCGGGGGDSDANAAPCDSVYAGKCGTSCEIDSECADGLYCSAAGTCTADCAPSAKCRDGLTCSARGRCGEAGVGGGDGGDGGDPFGNATTGAGGGSDDCPDVEVQF